MPRIGSLTWDRIFYWGRGTGHSFPTTLPRLGVAEMTMPTDGWITEHKLIVADELSDNEVLVIRPGIWAKRPNGDFEAIYRGSTYAPDQYIGTFTRFLSGKKVAKGTVLRAGFFTEDGIAKIGGRESGTNYTASPSSFPDKLPALSTASDGIGMALDYVANAAPLTGSWRSGSPSGTIATTEPNFQGTMPHPSSEDGHDYTSEVHLTIWPASNPTAPVYNASFATTSTERNQGYFSRAPAVLQSGVAYRAKFRHRDSFGTYSPYSTELSFTTAHAPNPPTLGAPAGKINAITGHSYVLTHAGHPAGLSANAYEIEVYNREGTTLLYSSGTVATSLAVGATATVPEFHADLQWGTDYSWRARLRDTASVWGAWTARQAFSTNRRPLAPANMRPVANKIIADRAFSATVSDPDGDAITGAQIELVRVSTGAVVAGYPKAMTVAASGASVSFVAPASDMVLNERYRYRMRATDGHPSGYGDYSGYVEYLHAEVPVVGLLTPQANGVTNLLVNPSAEDEASAAWEVSQITDNVTIWVTGEDASDREVSWRFDKVATDPGGTIRTLEKIAVDPSAMYLLSADFKRLSGTATAILRVDCYDNAGSLVGSVTPDTFGGLSGTDVGGAWDTYGGYLGAGVTGKAFPVGTTQVSVVIAGSDTTVAAVLVDAAMFVKLPAATLPELDAPWHGYADGATIGYGDGGYSWTDLEENSPSQIINILTRYGASVSFTYSSPTGAAKASDRLIIQRWDGISYRPHHDSGFVADSGGARRALGIPPGTLRNRTRYRIKVECKDAANAIGETDWAEVDVRLEGPKELPIVEVFADPLSGTISLTFERTDLAPLEFGGIEVKRRPVDGSRPEITVDLINNPDVGTWTDPFPLSDVTYEYRIRPIQNVGVEQVEGRYTTQQAACSYPGLWFVKSVEAPLDDWCAYKVYQDEIPSRRLGAPDVEFELRGRRDPVVHRFRARPVSSELVVRVKDGDSFVQDKAERERVMDKLLFERPTVCLLSSLPKHRHFAEFRADATDTTDELGDRIYTVSWTRVGYAEDFYEREGGLLVALGSGDVNYRRYASD